MSLWIQIGIVRLVHPPPQLNYNSSLSNLNPLYSVDARHASEHALFIDGGLDQLEFLCSVSLTLTILLALL